MNLIEYYETPWWINRSREFRKGKTCAHCGTKWDLHVHHLKYRFYQEKDSDLMVLCQSCHLRGIHKQKDENDLLDYP